MAFARVLDGQFALTIAPIMVFGHVVRGSMQLTKGFWADTVVRIPEHLRGSLRDVISGKARSGGEVLAG